MGALHRDRPRREGQDRPPDALRVRGRGGYRSHHAPELRRVHVQRGWLRQPEEQRTAQGSHRLLRHHGQGRHLHRGQHVGRVHRHALQPDRRGHHSGLLDSLYHYEPAGSEGSVGDDQPAQARQGRGRDQLLQQRRLHLGDHQRQGHRPCA